MGTSRTSSKKRKRQRRGAAGGRRRGGMMMGMRSGFKGIANSVAGKESRSDKYKWWGRIITVLLLAAAAGLLLSRM